MTTNGSILDDKKANWLMEHDFSLAVSLDGPKEEHDRLRVYRNGNGSFKDVMKNIGTITKMGYEKIFALPVFDWKSNLFNIEHFFNECDVPQVMRVSSVDNEEGCKYYDQFTKEDQTSFLDMLERARNYYFKKLNLQKRKEKTSFFDDLIGREPGRCLFESISVYNRRPEMPFTGACIPGRKIFVDVNGGYHMCERINPSFPIGNVDEGLNFETISKLISNYISHMDKCSDCKVRRKCGNCYKSFATDKGFSRSSEICEGIEQIMIEYFIRAFSIAETNPKFVDDINTKHINIKNYYED